MKIKEQKNIIKSIRKNIGNHSKTIKDIIRTIILIIKNIKGKNLKGLEILSTLEEDLIIKENL